MGYLDPILINHHLLLHFNYSLQILVNYKVHIFKSITYSLATKHVCYFAFEWLYVNWMSAIVSPDHFSYVM